MDPTQRQNIRRIFMEIADLPDDQRPDALVRLCAGDGSLHAEVESLPTHLLQLEKPTSKNCSPQRYNVSKDLPSEG